MPRKPTTGCFGPQSRRQFLQAGALALGGLTLADLLAARGAAKPQREDTAVILLHLMGGPSQLETYDLKPNAPSEYRSVFAPIATNVPGMSICEHYPLQAKLADKFSLIRSIHHSINIHNDGGILVFTGKAPTRPDPSSQAVSEHPDFGAIASKIRGDHPDALPRYVSTPRKLIMTQPAYLGAQHGPFVTGYPSARGFSLTGLRLPGTVSGQRLGERQRLRDSFDQLRKEHEHNGSLATSDKFRSHAFRILTTSRMSQAFDLDRESDRVAERYGRHRWGQQCLLARRLVEAGSTVVTVVLDTPTNGADQNGWDDHAGQNSKAGHFAMFMRNRMPYLDQALSALIEDIYVRGLDRKVMIVVMGEFGRAPRISSNSLGVGRDHWPAAQSVLVSGGGFRMGQAIGATNSRAEFPTERPYTPQDLLATIYGHLGIDPTHAFLDHSGRAVPILSEGKPIAELVRA